MLKMKGVSKIYRTDLIETHALRDFSVEIGAGDFVAVTGPSGSGKTTLLNIAGLLETFDGGVYELDGVDMSGLNDDDSSEIRNEQIGFIFQSFNLMPDLNLFENVDVPLRFRDFKAAERKRRIEESLELVGSVRPHDASAVTAFRRSAATRRHCARFGGRPKTVAGG